MKTNRNLCQTLLIIFLSIVSSFNGFTMCMSNGISVWPEKYEIAENTLFIVDGYSMSRQIIHGLNNKYKVYLKSGTEIIEFNVLRIIDGQYNLTQAILKPKTSLKMGKVYQLHIDSLNEFEHFDYPKWKVTKLADNEAPLWKCEPKYKSKNIQYFGCGPEMYVNFCGEFFDESPLLVYAKVFNEKTKNYVDYYLQANPDFIEIGHGMCSGEFSFDDSTTYSIQFGLMDASGNATEKLTDPISFSSPVDAETYIPASCACNSISLLNYILVGITIILLTAASLSILFLKKRRKSHL